MIRRALQDTAPEFHELLLKQVTNLLALPHLITEGLSAFRFMCRYLLNKFGIGCAEFLISMRWEGK